ncbi:hypothetical protein K8353_22000 [Burkholderia contaminans]|nr:hypothetical protein [Burkholderia contaminans]
MRRPLGRFARHGRSGASAVRVGNACVARDAWRRADASAVAANLRDARS